MELNKFIFRTLSDFNGNIGFYFKDLQDGKIIDINANKVFAAASVIKIPLALKMSALVADGKYSLQDKIVIKKQNKVGGTGIIQNLNNEYVPTVGELITLAISLSDNIATNELVDLVGGVDAVNEYCRSKGLVKTSMQRKMMDFEARKAGKDNYITAAEIGLLLEDICKISYADTNVEKAIIMPVFKGMVMQQCRNKIPAKIPAADYYDLGHNYLPPEGEVMVANKTGDLWSTQNDAAICVLPNGEKYILSICTDELQSGYEGIEVIADLSRNVYEYMKLKYE